MLIITDDRHHCHQHGPESGSLKRRETLESGSKQEETREHLRIRDSGNGRPKTTQLSKGGAGSSEAASRSKPHAYYTPSLTQRERREGEAGEGGHGKREDGLLNMTLHCCGKQTVGNGGPDDRHRRADNSVRASGAALAGRDWMESSVRRDPCPALTVPGDPQRDPAIRGFVGNSDAEGPLDGFGKDPDSRGACRPLVAPHPGAGRHPAPPPRGPAPRIRGASEIRLA